MTLTLPQQSRAQGGFFAPGFEVRISGVGLPRDVLRDVTRLTYQDSLKEVDGFELTVNNWDAASSSFKYVGNETAGDLDNPASRARLFDPCNKEIVVRMGYLGHLQDMVTGMFTTLEPDFPATGASTLAVRGLNTLHRLRRKQYCSEWAAEGTGVHAAGWKDSEIALDIAQRTDKDLGTDQKRFPVPVIVHRSAMEAEERQAFVAQNNQYDIDFLLTRARRRGYVVYFSNGNPDGATAPERAPHVWFGPSASKPAGAQPTFELRRGISVIDFKPTLTTANQVKSVTVKGWDRAKKKAFSVKVSLDDKEMKLNRDLHQLLKVCDPREEITIARPVANEKEAKAKAMAVLKENGDRLVKATLTTIGLPDLRSGMNARIVGFGARFDGSYFITSSKHIIDDNGYLTKLEVRRELLEGMVST